MKDMLYGDIPDFETVMSAVKELEKEIKHLISYINAKPDYSNLSSRVFLYPKAAIFPKEYSCLIHIFYSATSLLRKIINIIADTPIKIG